MRETAVEQHLRARVQNVGGLCEKHVSPGQRASPDRLITWPWGVMQLVETKAPGLKPRENQRRDHARRLRRGVVVLVLDTKEKVDEWVAGILAARNRQLALGK